jgi:hypothetical protein
MTCLVEEGGDEYQHLSRRRERVVGNWVYTDGIPLSMQHQKDDGIGRHSLYHPKGTRCHEHCQKTIKPKKSSEFPTQPFLEEFCAKWFLAPLLCGWKYSGDFAAWPNGLNLLWTWYRNLPFTGYPKNLSLDRNILPGKVFLLRISLNFELKMYCWKLIQLLFALFFNLKIT